MRKSLAIFILLLACSLFLKNYSLSQQKKLVISKDTIDFGKIYYGMKNTREISFINNNSFMVIIDSIDNLKKPFSGNFTVPDTFASGSVKTYELSYKPEELKEHIQRVFFKILGQLEDENTPLSIAMVFDVSGSMAFPFSEIDPIPRLEAAQKAANILIDSLKKNDEACIIAFDDHFYFKQAFTNDKQNLKKAIDSLRWNGNTKMYDALYQTLDYLRNAKNKPIIVVLTDGASYEDTTPIEIVIGLAQSREVKIYAIGIGTELNETDLVHLSVFTGGEFYYTNNSTELLQLYTDIRKMFNTQSFVLKGICAKPDISLNLKLKTIKTAKPGSMVEVPVYAYLSPNYDPIINSIEISVKYKKSVLHFIEPVITDNTLSQRMKSISIKTNYDSVYAITKIVLNGGEMINTTSENELFKMKFLALLGDTISSNITFEDISINKFMVPYYSEGFAHITIDSICYLCDRLIEIKSNQKVLLKQNKPNPFNLSTKIGYEVRTASEIKIKIFDLLGRKVRDINDGWRDKGTYEYEFNAADLTSGLYFYTIENGGNEVRKMLLLK
jgi:uncharacterized protein YegL